MITKAVVTTALLVALLVYVLYGFGADWPIFAGATWGAALVGAVLGFVVPRRWIGMSLGIIGGAVVLAVTWESDLASDSEYGGLFAFIWLYVAGVPTAAWCGGVLAGSLWRRGFSGRALAGS